MASKIAPIYEVFPGINGAALSSGNIYIGTAGLNPETNPITVYWDEALTVPAAQPIQTINGFPSNGNTVSNIYVSENQYSISVRDRGSNVLVHSDLNVTNQNSQVLVDLANTSDVAKGAGLVGQAIQVIGGAATAKTIAPVATRHLWMDGSYWHAVTGASPGTYSDDANVALAYGTVIIPTGGDGSAAWVRFDAARLGFNVKWFGATGDGVTIDYQAIFDAYTALVAKGGGDLEFPEGTYLIDTQFNINSRDIKVVGQGKDCTFIKRNNTMTATDATVYVGANGDFNSIAHLQIDNDNIAGAGADGLRYYNANECKLTEVYINNVGVGGICLVFERASSNDVDGLFAVGDRCLLIDDDTATSDVGNQITLRDISLVGSSTTDPAALINRTTSFVMAEYLIEHQGQGLKLGPDVDAANFHNGYIEQADSDVGTLPQVDITDSGGACEGISFTGFTYFQQNGSSNNSAFVQIAGNTRNVSLENIRFSKTFYNITGITNASSAVVTVSAAHGIKVGDVVGLNFVVGMTEVNGNSYTVTNVSGNDITLNVDSTLFGAWTSAGRISWASEDVLINGGADNLSFTNIHSNSAANHDIIKVSATGAPTDVSIRNVREQGGSTANIDLQAAAGYAVQNTPCDFNTTGSATDGVLLNVTGTISDSSNRAFMAINGRTRVRKEVTSVSNPPTDAELDAAFGTPATVGQGWATIIDDGGAGNNFWRIYSDGTNWWHSAFTKAV